MARVWAMMRFVRCPVLVGRRPAAATLAAALETATGGHGSWLTITGEAGVGKSRLASETVATVAERGGWAAVGRCSQVDRGTPYRPLAELLLSAAHGVPRPNGAAELAPYLPAVARFVPHWRRSGRAAVTESPAIVGESALRVLTRLAGGRVTLVIVEDLHWADPDSLAVCDYLVDHLDHTPILVVATARPDELSPATASIVQRGAVLPLSPLGRAEVAELVSACLGADPPPGLVDRVVRQAGGLPLVVEDLVSQEVAGVVGPTRFDQLVASRFAALSDGAQRTVVAAALLGDRFTIDLLAEAAPIDGGRAALTEAAHEAAAAQLIVGDGGGLVFRHALTRDAVLGAAPALVAALTPAAAQALEQSRDDAAASRAAQLWRATGDNDRAARLWLAAADAAERDGAPATASDLLALAADAAGSSPFGQAVALARLRFLVSHGHVDEAIRIGTTLSDTSIDPAAVGPLLARALLDAGRPDEASAQLRRPADGHDGERLLLLARCRLQGFGPDRRLTAEHLARQAVALATVGAQPAVACEALEIVARCARSRSLADAEGALRQALPLAESLGSPSWRLRISNELGTIDMLRDADGARLYRARQEALAAGALDVAVAIDVNIASLHCMRNELAEGGAAAERAAAGADRLGLRPLAAAAAVMQGLAFGFRGQRVGLERHLRRAEELAPQDADLRAFAWSAGRGLCALVREERDDAVACLRRGVRDDPPVGSLDAACGPLLLVLAATGSATPEEQTAATAVATPGAAWSDLWLGFANAALGGGMAAFGPAERAAHCHPLFRALGLRLVAEAALRDGWGDPLLWLRDAEAVFVAGGQDRAAAGCRALLGRAGQPTARRRGADRRLRPDLLRRGVTAREAEVLDLIAERLGNKDIAARLFLSPRTVEKHVASLLTKLDAGGRGDLVEIGRLGAAQ